MVEPLAAKASCPKRNTLQLCHGFSSGQAQPAVLFKETPDGLSAFSHIRREHRKEYAKFVARQLLRSKVDLRFDVKAEPGHHIPCREEKDSQKECEVWNGIRSSSASRRPPKPRHVTIPFELLNMENTLDRPFRLTKRDGLVQVRTP